MQEPPALNRLETEEQTRKEIKDSDGIDFPSVTKELDGIMGTLQGESEILNDDEGPRPLSEEEWEQINDFLPHVARNYEDEREWIDRLELIQEKMEGDRFIEEAAFIEADHDYSDLMDDKMINFLQENGENDRKAMYRYLCRMIHIFKRTYELAKIEDLHQSSSETQHNDPSTEQTAERAAESPEDGGSAAEESPAGREAS